MDAPHCDVIGCPASAGWLLTSDAPPLSNEYLCDAHLAAACLRNHDLARDYTQWNVFLATAVERRRATVRPHAASTRLSRCSQSGGAGDTALRPAANDWRIDSCKPTQVSAFGRAI